MNHALAHSLLPIDEFINVHRPVIPQAPSSSAAPAAAPQPAERGPVIEFMLSMSADPQSGGNRDDIIREVQSMVTALATTLAGRRSSNGEQTASGQQGNQASGQQGNQSSNQPVNQPTNPPPSQQTNQPPEPTTQPHSPASLDAILEDTLNNSLNARGSQKRSNPSTDSSKRSK